MPTIFGYIRVSTNKGQTTANQRKEIEDNGYVVKEENWYSDAGVSGSTPQFERPAFKAMYSQMEDGDIIIVSKIDRLGRGAQDALNTISVLKKRGIKVVVIQFGGVDMNSTAGKLLTTVLSAVAEMERDLCIERITSGLVRTKAEGTILGPPLKITPDIMEILCDEREEGTSLTLLAEKYNINRSSIDRSVKQWAGKLPEYRKEYDTRLYQYKLAEEKRLDKAKRVFSA